MLSPFPARESRPDVITVAGLSRQFLGQRCLGFVEALCHGRRPQKTTAADPSELIALAIRQILRGGGVYGQPPLTF